MEERDLDYYDWEVSDAFNVVALYTPSAAPGNDGWSVREFFLLQDEDRQGCGQRSLLAQVLDKFPGEFMPFNFRMRVEDL
eukprot:3526583-Pyramimonas_sp.AAC.2